MINLILDDARERMQKAVGAFENDLETVRTGRASPLMLDRIQVDYWGAPTPIKQVASVSVSEGRQLVVKPYDKTVLKNIEFAEQAKVAIRNIRRDANEDIKKSDVSEDEVKRGQERVQKLTDEFTKKVDALGKEKEKEIMTV